MADLDFSATAKTRGLRLTALAVGSFLVLAVLAPTQAHYRKQIITPYISGLRASLNEETAGLRVLARAILPADLVQAGRELSGAYWEEVSRKVEEHTTTEQYLFLTQYKTRAVWGYGDCETEALGVAGLVWITGKDTCGMGPLIAKGGTR